MKSSLIVFAVTLAFGAGAFAGVKLSGALIKFSSAVEKFTAELKDGFARLEGAAKSIESVFQK